LIDSIANTATTRSRAREESYVEREKHRKTSLKNNKKHARNINMSQLLATSRRAVSRHLLLRNNDNATNAAAVVASTSYSSLYKQQQQQQQQQRKLFGSESHDDFAAKSHVDASNVHDEIASDVKKETVVIYMKGSPNAPQCGFSNVACRILDHYGIPYASRNVLASDALRNGIKSFSNWPTIPQVFVGGEFLGGSDILMTMHQDGSLKKEFERVGLTVKTKE
jgi:monothiol glutaredoxin